MATETTKLTFVEGAAASIPASGRGVVYFKADGLAYSKDDAGAETLMSSGSSGSVATDPIWDAAGDTVVGTGANTAARLAIGAAGGALSRVNGAVAWNSGTSFPTAATGDRYWRTDLAGEFYYNGTIWLSTTLYRIDYTTATVGASSGATAATVLRANSLGALAEIYITTIDISVYVITTNTGSAFWTFTHSRWDFGTGTAIGSVNTSAASPDGYVKYSLAVNAAFSGIEAFSTDAVKTGSPGNYILVGSLFARAIAT